MLAYVVLAVTVYGVSFAWMRSGLLRARRQAQEATDRMALAGHEMRTAVGAVAGLCGMGCSRRNRRRWSGCMPLRAVRRSCPAA